MAGWSLRRGGGRFWLVSEFRLRGLGFFFFCIESLVDSALFSYLFVLGGALPWESK